MGDFHLEDLRREILEALHRLLRSHARAWGVVYTQGVREEGVGKTTNSKPLCLNTMSLSRGFWRHRSGTRRGTRDQTERETSCYGSLLFNFKSSVRTCSTSFCGDNNLQGGPTEMDQIDHLPRHTSSQSKASTRSETRPDKSSLHFLLSDFEILLQTSSMN